MNLRMLQDLIILELDTVSEFKNPAVLSKMYMQDYEDIEYLQEELAIKKRHTQVLAELNYSLKSENTHLREEIEEGDRLILKEKNTISEQEKLYKEINELQQRLQTLTQDFKAKECLLNKQSEQLTQWQKTCNNKDIELNVQFRESENLKAEQVNLRKELKDQREQNQTLSNDTNAIECLLTERNEQLTKWQETCKVLVQSIGDTYILTKCNVDIGEKVSFSVAMDNVDLDKLDEVTNTMLMEITDVKNQVFEMKTDFKDFILKVNKAAMNSQISSEANPDKDLEKHLAFRSDIQEINETYEKMLHLREEENEKSIIEKGVKCISSWIGSETDFTVDTLPIGALPLHALVMVKKNKRNDKLAVRNYDIIPASGGSRANDIAKWLFRLVKGNPNNPVERLQTEIRRFEIEEDQHLF